MPTHTVPRVKPTYANDKVITLIFSGWIATVASDTIGPCPEDIIKNGALAIEGSRIAAVGTAEQIKNIYKELSSETEEIHLSEHHILIPGLINCHTHLAMSFLRGIADDQDLNTWLTKYIWPTEQAIMGFDYVYYGTLIAAYEAIRSGTTMLNDSYFVPDGSIKAIKEAGIRCVLAQPLLDFGNGELETQWKDAQALILKLRESAAKPKTSGDHLIRPSFNPHACYTVPQSWIQKGSDFISKLNKEKPSIPVICHIHLHETKKERQQYEESHKRSALQSLQEAGALNRYLVAAHCVEMNSEEIKLLAENKVNVCHCPKSNLKLASGFAPIAEMLQAGVNVCLGTDGGCSNNSVDMLSEMRMAALSNKAAANDPKVLDAYTVLRMATRNGSKALGRLGDLGSLEVGKLADVVAVDLCGEGMVGLPIYDPISHLIYTTQTRVTDVWVNGNQIMKNKNIQTVKLDPKQYSELYDKTKKLRETLISAKLN